MIHQHYWSLRRLDCFLKDHMFLAGTLLFGRQPSFLSLPFLKRFIWENTPLGR